MNRSFRGIVLCAGALCLAASVPISAQSLPGFTLTGESWSYDPADGGPVISGILSKPPGAGPFPAVLISHGKGGTAGGFALPKARVMTNWSLVCIGPNYTHAGSGSSPEQEGWSPENSRRADACLTILESLGYVDLSRVAVYGNSMGAFVSAGFCGAMTNRIRAAAITAGGSSGTANTNVASPAIHEVQGIVAPFLLLHGTTDATVPPAQSANLQFILNSNGVPNNRILFEGMGHDLHSNTATSNTVLAFIRDWFVQWGVLEESNAPGPRLFGVLETEGFRLTLSSDRPRIYEIQTSSNLVHWSHRTLLTNDAGTVFFIDTNWPSLQGQFFRALEVP
jgi:dienelactone hydrolase